MLYKLSGFHKTYVICMFIFLKLYNPYTPILDSKFNLCLFFIHRYRHSLTSIENTIAEI